MTVQMRQFGNCAVKLNEYQQRIETSNNNLERLILSISASKDILSFGAINSMVCFKLCNIIQEQTTEQQVEVKPPVSVDERQSSILL